MSVCANAPHSILSSGEREKGDFQTIVAATLAVAKTDDGNTLEAFLGIDIRFLSFRPDQETLPPINFAGRDKERISKVTSLKLARTSP